MGFRSILTHIKTWNDPDPETAYKKKEYTITKVLGQGAYGVVKEAIHNPSQTKCAIKSILKSSVKTKRSVDQVNREVQILHDIKHPNIVALYDFFETKGKYYMVFEVASGGELFDRIARHGKFTEIDAANIIYQILDGLSALHEKNVVHRDLKPENILYIDPSPDSRLVIADFGISNYVEEDVLLSTVIGSPGYTAPEVIKKTGHTTSCDLWAVGVITYMLIGGYHPFFFAEDLPDLLDAICRAAYKFDAHYWRNVSNEAKDFIKSLIVTDPSKRPTAKECMRSSWMLNHCKKARANVDTSTVDMSKHALRSEGSIPNLVTGWAENEVYGCEPKFQAKKAFKRAISAVSAMNTLKTGKSLSKLNDG